MNKIFSTSWFVWLFPVLALITTGSLYYKYWSHRGPLIEIHFSDASGIEAEKTPLRFRGIRVGQVEKVILSDNPKGVKVFARLEREAESLAVEGTQFLIVQPEVDFAGVRGLETLFKGSYIRVDQGKGQPATQFRGQVEGGGDSLNAGVISYTLRSRFLDSITAGDFVTYRGLKVGTVSNLILSPTSQWVDIQIEVEKKYVKLIRTNTAFWPKVAVEAKVGLLGAKIKIGSLESLIRGGISFATPNEPAKIADAGSRFDLQASPPKDWEKWTPEL